MFLKYTKFLLSISILLSIQFAFGQSHLFINSQHGLQSDSVLCLEEGDLGEIWIGTTSGMSKMDKFGTVTPIAATNGSRVNDIGFHPISGVWAATSNGLVNYNQGSISIFGKSNGFKSDSIGLVEVLDNGAVWCTNDSSVYRLNGSNATKFNFSNTYPGSSFPRMQISSASNILFFRTINAFQVKIDGNTDQFLNLYNSEIPNMTFSHNSKIYGWAGNILFELNNNSWILYDSIPISPNFSDPDNYGFDNSTGKVLVKSRGNDAIYDIGSKTYTKFDWSFELKEIFPFNSLKSLVFNYMENRVLGIRNSIRDYGLIVYYIKNSDTIPDLSHGKLSYTYLDRNIMGNQYLDTLGKEIPLTHFDGCNIVANVQGVKRAASLSWHGQTGKDWLLGPVSNDYILPSYQNKYGHLFKVTKAEVEAHKLNFNTTGYVAPSSILDWPGNGNTYAGEALTLAPFYDVNNNGSYEPYQGDYPEIPGDECLYLIQREPVSPGYGGMGLELHRFIYTINDNSYENQNTVYQHRSLINRGSVMLDSVQFSFLSDLDVGDENFNQAAFDSTGNAFYAFRKERIYEYDYITGTYDYFPYQIAAGYTSLDKKITSHQEYWPWEQAHLFSQSSGLNFDGTPISDTITNDVGQYRYVWDGDTTFSFTEIKNYLGRGDIRQTATLEPITLLPGEKACFNFAFAYAVHNDSTDGIAALKKAKQRIDAVRANWQNQSCLMPTLSNDENDDLFDLVIYPNPSQGRVVIETIKDIDKVEVYSSSGKRIYNETCNSNKVDIELNLKAGLYLVRIESGDEVRTEKLMIVH